MTKPLRCPWGVGMGAAIAEIDRRTAEAAERRAAQQAVRLRLRVIDDLLDELEERHLQDRTELTADVRGRLVAIERGAGVRLDRSVRGAPDTVALHSALLDLEEAILDEVCGPGRRLTPAA